MRRFAMLSVLPMFVLVVGCQPQADDPRAADETAAVPTAKPPTLEELRNATYLGLEEPGGPVTLVDGQWEGEPYEEGAASRPTVTLVRDLHVLGDLDGDGVDEAAVVVAEDSGGTGRFVHVAVVARGADGLDNVATTLLGDRVQIRSVRIEGGRLLVDVLRAGPEDAACCPGELATQGFTLEDDGLKPFDAGTPSARLSLEALTGTEWVLRSWTRDEPAPAEPEVTLQYVEGRFAGSSGCNRYSAPVKEVGGAPGGVAVGPGMGTMMACPDSAMSVESRFLKQLEGVKNLGFATGQLMLVYESDGESDAMLFEGRPPESSERP